MKQLNLVVDTIKENHFIPRNAKYFVHHCDKFAIHYGWNNIPSQWAKRIGGTHPDIEKFYLDGEPWWIPNCVLIDLGRNYGGANRLTIPNGILKILWCADEHRHNDPLGGNKGQPYIDYANQFDYIFLRQKSVIEKYPRKKTFWFPHSVQDKCIPKEIKPQYDIVFIGRSVTPEREQMIKALKEIGCNIYMKTEGNLNEAEYINAMSMGRIVINRTQTDYEINKRVFESIGSGSMLVTNRTKKAGLEELFKDKKDLVLYDNFDHMIELIKYYLNNEEERKKIAESGHKKILEKHTSSKRVEQIVNFIRSKL